MSSTYTSENFRPVDEDDLVEGETLPADLCDRGGRVLLRAGEVFTAQARARLRQRGCLGLYLRELVSAAGDEPRPHPGDSDPNDVVAALERQQAGAATRDPNRRRHERHSWSAVLELDLEERTPEGVAKRKLKVKTDDISARGMSFFHHHYLHPGSIIRARFDSLEGRPCLTAIVRHCTHVEGQQHRIGAEFVKIARR